MIVVAAGLMDSLTLLMTGGAIVVGHVITVSEKAVPAHRAHGDSEVFYGLDTTEGSPWLTWRALAEWYGVDLEGANCAFAVGRD